ncbi:P-loop containing nucleoside triphosphate hydrolase protein [Cokeromyces recurvatus]|uniref:P-loop containing nucleoside triphosphate hydrolase protein n=1 Tax=Cokeromyces recurvatus TaxID=90255 RepID=UPI00221F5353|nr:P-loop containing nucleoside triphosphate hydrolase protein [Cokeromyces recurvatus]KAI7903223.1 P-loop containing nucleoside triphosphate hydrolase protein [Cokeromyces recurvatus]
MDEHESSILNKIIQTKTPKTQFKHLLQVDHNLTAYDDKVVNPAKKRTLQEFLDDYNSTKTSSIVIESDEEDPPEIEDEEKIKALKEIEFTINKKHCQLLKTHQLEGLQFMWNRIYKKRHGCLLAHTMGLGKTFQTIVLLTALYEQLQQSPSSNFPTGKRVLILAPLITLSNWVNEFDKWSVNMENVIGEVFTFSGLGFRDTDRSRFLKYWYTHGGVMLMTYEQFRILLTGNKRNDKIRDEYYTMLINPGADVIVLDEGHRIKNSMACITNLVKQIRTQIRICLTGYPLQNHLSEYYHMLSFVAPDILGSPESFKAYFKTQIERCYADSSIAVKRQAALKSIVFRLLTENVTHRRDGTILTKELPPKTEYAVYFTMSPVQYEGYVNILQLSNGVSPLTGLLILRAICNHPKIFQSLLKRRQEKQRKITMNKEYGTRNVDIADNEVEDEIVSIPENTTDGMITLAALDTELIEDDEVNIFEKWLSNGGFDWAISYLEKSAIESWKCSGKMSFIVDLAKDCQVMKEKLIIVSHSVACLDYIQHLLPVFGIKISRIDGSTVTSERQLNIDRFYNEDENIDAMLLSAKAAAIGINLTAASRIVLVDQDWNPLYDEQSIGRIFRLGQKKSTVVYRLISATTIEERIFAQSIHKRNITSRIIDNKKTIDVSKEEVKNYFALPSSNLKPINVDTVEESIKNDFISFSCLKQNRDCITQFILHDQDKLDNTNYEDMLNMDEVDIEQAKHEAKILLRKWKKRQRC